MTNSPIKLLFRSKMAVLPMLDTVQIRGNWPLLTPLPAGWRKLRNGVRFHVGPLGDSVIAVECSLPQLMFDHNGRVLANQDELDGAYSAMRRCFEAVADLGDHHSWRPWRLDLAWNFELPAKPFVFAHAPLRVRRIKSDATLHRGGQGVSWQASRSRFQITLYDKSKKMRVPGSVLRAEVKLCAEHLTRHFGNAEWWSFEAQSAVFKQIMSAIPPIRAVVQVNDVFEAIGLQPPEVRDGILASLAHKPDRTLRRWRARIEAPSAKLTENFSWGALLESGLPSPVTVQPNYRRSTK